MLIILQIWIPGKFQLSHICVRYTVAPGVLKLHFWAISASHLKSCLTVHFSTLFKRSGDEQSKTE